MILVFVITLTISISGQPDSSKFTIIPFGENYCWIFKNCKPTSLTTGDLSNIENLLTKCLNDFNATLPKINNKNINKDETDIIKLENYKRQYMPVLNETGEKEVWINCFCSSEHKNWEKEVVFAKDGGNCYFNLKINLTKLKYFVLQINGKG